MPEVDKAKASKDNTGANKQAMLTEWDLLEWWAYWLERGWASSFSRAVLSHNMRVMGLRTERIRWPSADL